MKLVKGTKSKYIAIFDDGKRIPFGSPVSTTYAEGASKKKRDAYLKRHAVNEDWTKRSAGALSRWILWEKPSVSAGLKEFKKRVRSV